jgi:hypothetical protein
MAGVCMRDRRACESVFCGGTRSSLHGGSAYSSATPLAAVRSPFGRIRQAESSFVTWDPCLDTTSRHRAPVHECDNAARHLSAVGTKKAFSIPVWQLRPESSLAHIAFV